MGMNIQGTGSSVPAQVVTNHELSRILDTSDEWIRTRTGIEKRHILSDGEDLVTLGASAVSAALDMAGGTVEDIDLLICCTVGGDHLSPSGAALIKEAVGLPDTAVTFDLNMGCCGFVYALRTAEAYLSSGMARRAVVVATEGLSRHVDWSDRATACLFGDAAAAVVLAPSDKPCRFSVKVSGNATDLGIGRAPDNCPYRSERSDSARKLFMNGQEIYKFAVSSVPARIDDLLAASDLSADEVDFFYLHQANLRIIDSAVRRLKVPPERVPHNIEQYGNTSSASIPLLLDRENRAGRLFRGARIILCAFGAGLSSAGCLLEW